MKKYLLPIFFSAFFATLSFILYKNSITEPLLHGAFLLLIAAGAYVFSAKENKFLAIALFIASSVLLLPPTYYINSFYVVDLHIAMFTLGAYFVFEKDVRTTLKKIGFPGGLKTALLYGIGGVFLLVAAGTLVNLVLYMGFGVADAAKIQQKVVQLPLYVLIFAVLAAPFSEEMFFRAFMIDGVGNFLKPYLSGAFRNKASLGLALTVLGALVSSALFAVSHIAYGSVLEITGAFTMGLVFSWVYKHTGSITPCMIMHFLYNLMAIVVMKMVGG